MRLVLLPIVLVALAVTAAARARDYETVALPAADHVSLPFLCNWGYDREERCYRDRLERLELGGAEDKVWRSALRSSLAAMPPGAWVVWDVTDVVSDWLSGAAPNDGILL